jgi:glycosyltransferase involved in cell wall biosynthesis
MEDRLKELELKVAQLRQRLEQKNALLKKRKGKELKLRDERNSIRADLRVMQANAAAAQAALVECKQVWASSQRLSQGTLLQQGGGKSPSTLQRWWRGLLHRWLAPRVWRAEMRLGVLHQHEPRSLVTDPLPTLAADTVWPSISIVTPSYQQAEYLERTLRSVLDQGYPALEYVVMDGGSQDGSVNIIQRYAARLKHWQSERDNGLSHALKAGFAHTKAEIMAWLNSDDMLLPGTLHRVGQYFATHPEVDAVYGHRVLIQEQDQQIGRWVLPPHDAEFNRWVDYLPQETLFWRRSAFEKAGGIDASFRFAVDWDLILRLQNTGAVFRRLPYFLGAFRVHEAQKSQTEISSVGAQECQRLRTRELKQSFHETLLPPRVVRFQARALLYDWLLRYGIRR